MRIHKNRELAGNLMVNSQARNENTISLSFQLSLIDIIHKALWASDCVQVNSFVNGSPHFV